MSKNKIIEIDPKGEFVKLSLSNEEKVQMIAFYYDMYWNTDQDAAVFGEEYYHLTIGLCKGEIPCKLEYLSDYKDGLIEEFPELTDVIQKYVQDDFRKVKKRKPIAANGRPIEIGSIVMSSPKGDYELLVGTVFDIKLLGSPDRDTENDTDDVYCNFVEFDYSDQRIKEIEEVLSALYQMPKTIDDSCIDFSIEDPAYLIVIDEVPEEVLKSEAAAQEFWDKVMAEAEKGE